LGNQPGPVLTHVPDHVGDTGINLQSFLAEEKARASLKKAFQSYVAPSVVEEIIKHPERLRLGANVGI